MNEKCALFTDTVDKHFRSFVNQLHEYLTENVCKCDIKSQKATRLYKEQQKDFGSIRVPKNLFCLFERQTEKVD